MYPNETKIYIALLIIAFTLVIVVTFFALTILRHRRRSLRLYKEKVAAEITTREAERKRIASDLHDDFGPHMSAIKLQLASLGTKMPGDEEVIQKINVQIDELVQKIRVISNNLVPLVLARKGFNVALNQFTGTISDTAQLQVIIDRQTDAEPAGETALHLYRIIHEIVNNTIRHANATRCIIEIKMKDGLLQYYICDDGVGFNYHELSRMKLGFGLQNILSRAEMINAKIFVDARPSKGVRYEIEIPHL